MVHFNFPGVRIFLFMLSLNRLKEMQVPNSRVRKFLATMPSAFGLHVHVHVQRFRIDVNADDVRAAAHLAVFLVALLDACGKIDEDFVWRRAPCAMYCLYGFHSDKRFRFKRNESWKERQPET